jgi:hypothetical protein
MFYNIELRNFVQMQIENKIIRFLKFEKIL